MTTPIQSNPSALDPSIHYDDEAGLCVAPPATSPAPSRPSAPPTAQGDQGSPAAVAQLVKNAPTEREDCAMAVGEAGAFCATAVLNTLISTASGPGAIAVAALLGAQCGFKAMKAKDCLE